jgi:hypothetical protein
MINDSDRFKWMSKNVLGMGYDKDSYYWICWFDNKQKTRRTSTGSSFRIAVNEAIKIMSREKEQND